VQQQMMQQSRQLDPSLLVKQQTPPSQQPLHQPAMKSFLDNVMPHTTPELQKGPSPVNAFSNFPIGEFLLGTLYTRVSTAFAALS
jgi:trinucleotide repeat-containing gene 6 protein